MRGKVLPHWTNLLTRQRALDTVGHHAIHYHLQYPNGGTNPSAAAPHDPETGGCDCIGFAAWCTGFDRFQPKRFPFYDGYINTDSMIQEAVSRGKWFTVLDKPEDGCFIVSPSFRRKLPPFNRVIGHIGVVVDASEYATKGLAGLSVVHCSSGNEKKYGRAVWKTSGAVWARYPRALVIRFNRDYVLRMFK